MERKKSSHASGVESSSKQTDKKHQDSSNVRLTDPLRKQWLNMTEKLLTWTLGLNTNKQIGIQKVLIELTF